MKKRMLSLLLSLVMAVSLVTPAAQLTVAAESAPLTVTDGGVFPELIITEIVPNTTSTDRHELLEICNISSRSVNVYDYAFAYSASGGTSTPNELTDIKAGDIGILSATGIINPDTMVLNPGENVVVWSYTDDSVAAAFTFNDFKTYWSLGADAKVIAFDARATTYADRFNMPNSGKKAVNIVKDGYVLSPATPQLLVSTAAWDTGTALSTPADNAAMHFSVDLSAVNVRVLTAPTVYSVANPGVVDADQVSAVTDPAAPSINHTPLNANIGLIDTTIMADVTDDTALKQVTLYYKVQELNSYTAVTMIKVGATDSYSYTIPKAQLIGADHLYYYIEAKDYLHTTTAASAVAPCASQIVDMSNANLSELWVGNNRIGIGSPDYTDANGNENYIFKATALPTVAGTAESSYANVTVTQASADNANVATVTVVSGDNTKTKTYTVTINLVARKNSDILLTEAMPNGPVISTGGSGDEAELVEVYNDASYPINIYDYAIGYKTSSTGSYRAVVPQAGNPGIGGLGPINLGDPKEPLNPAKTAAILKPGETAAIWIYGGGCNTTNTPTKPTRADFLTKYPMCPASKLFIIDGRNDGTNSFNLANTGNRWLAFLTPVRGTATYNQEISVLGYNIGADTDGADGKTTIYQADPAGSVNMIYLKTGNAPTPGVVDSALQLIDFTDIVPPSISHTQAVTSLTSAQNIPLSATITDANLKTNKVRILYKTEDIFEYASLTVTNTGDTFSATIPAAVVGNTASVKYYFEATDGPNVVTSPIYTITMPNPSDTKLKSLSFRGTPLVNFDSAKTWYELPLTGENPTLADFAAVTNTPTATCVVSAYSSQTGNVTITVTSANTSYSKVYTVHFFAGNSSNTRLASLTAGGVPVRAFESGITTFRVQFVGETPPEVAALPDNATSTVEITQATAGNPTAQVKVISPSGENVTYTINFVPAAALPNYPDLVVTEIMPNPLDDITGNKQPYEYMEVYNTSDRDINIKDYTFVYFSDPNLPETVIKYTDVTNDLTIKPKDTLVIWIRYTDSVGKTFGDFNRHYGAKLDAQHLIDIPGSVTPNFNLANSGMKRISLCLDSYMQDLTYQTSEQIEANPKFVSTFIYGENTEFSDVARGLSINFKPVSGSKQVEKYEWCVDPSTGYQKPEQMVKDYDDPAAPTLTDTTVAAEPFDLGTSTTLIVTAHAWDETALRYVRLYYKTDSMSVTQVEDMTPAAGDTYSITIPRNELVGETYIDYRIEIADGLNTVYSPASGYKRVAIRDSFGPTIQSVKPQDKYYFAGSAQPTISAQFSDPSNINTASVTLSMNGTDVTADTIVTGNTVSYKPATSLTDGLYTAVLSLTDTVGNNTTKTWTFTVGPETYNFYAGMLHSHTAESDGAGTVTEAYNYAKNTSKLDFYGLTDHAHYLTLDKFNNQKYIASMYDEPGKFVTIPGFEMTWNANVGWWGHMNAFNTSWIETLLTNNQNMPYFYNRLASTPGSLGQFNHPGDSWGDFSSYAYWSPQIDSSVDLFELRNSTHEKDYVRALDAGWHLTPVNNDDTHTKGWGSSGAAGVVLAPSLTFDNIVEAIHAHRSYSTTDRTIQIKYYGNGQIMGAQLKNINELSLNVKINYATANVGLVEIITDTGFVIASKNEATKALDWTLNVPVTNKYYYVRVTTANGKYAVTAPIWVENDNAMVVDKTVIGNKVTDAAVPYEVSVNVSNTADTDMTYVVAQVYRNNIASGSPIPVTNIPAKGSCVISIPVAYDASNRDVVISLSGDVGAAKAGKLINVMLPELLITEIVTRNSATTTNDPYQYIELYNASGRAINLANYKFIWYSKCDTTESWDITSNFTIDPYSTAVVWIKCVSDTAALAATLDGFNSQYGTNLTTSQVLTLIVPSTLNSSTGHKIYLDTDNGVIQQMISYNIEFEVGKENIANKSIQYGIDAAQGTYIQKKIGAGYIPTPGTVASYQIPYTGSTEDAMGMKNDQLPMVLSGVSNKVYGDSAFTVLATAGSGGGAITYASSNTAVATVNAQSGVVTIVAAGQATITATKAGDSEYASATVSGALTVAPKPITVTAQNKEKMLMSTDPAFTYTVSPSISGLSPLVGSLSRDQGEASGFYAIKQGTLSSDNNPNYLITFIDAKLEIIVLTSTTPITPTTPTTPTTPSAPTTPSQGENSQSGSATVNSSGTTQNGITTHTISAAAVNGVTGANIQIEAPAAQGATTSSVSIAGSAVSTIASNGTKSMSINTGIADVSFDSSSITYFAESASAGTVNLSVSSLNVSSLSQEAREEIGSRPVVEFSLSVNGQSIATFGGTAIVSIPYKPVSDEDINALVVYYIDGSGKLNMISNCTYNPQTGLVTFAAQHFSKYAVGYKKVAFSDTVNHWASEYITYLAARDIIGGYNSKFDPNANITRGQFTKILAGLAGADLSGYSTAKFSDVDGDNIYAKHITWASSKGIVNGVGNGKFDPNAKITREQIVIMLKRFAGDKAVMDAQIFDSINGGISNPKGNASRAEVAKMLSKLMMFLLASKK